MVAMWLKEWKQKCVHVFNSMVVGFKCLKNPKNLVEKCQENGLENVLKMWHLNGLKCGESLTKFGSVWLWKPKPN